MGLCHRLLRLTKYKGLCVRYPGTLIIAPPESESRSSEIELIKRRTIAPTNQCLFLIYVQPTMFAWRSLSNLICDLSDDRIMLGATLGPSQTGVAWPFYIRLDS